MAQNTSQDIAAPLFLLAPGRCFSSLVCAMLGQHPQMFALLETQLLTRDFMSEWWEDFGSNVHSHGLLRSVAEIIFGEQTAAAIKEARRWLWRRRACRTAEVLTELAEQIFPLVLIDKTPMVTYRMEHLERIRSAFPQAHFMHLLRHPAGYGLSLLEFYRMRAPHRQPRQMLSLVENPESIFFRLFDPSDESPVLDPQESWHLRQSTVSKFLATLPEEQCLAVRAEDLLRDTLQSLRRICHWLGIRADDAAIEEMLHPERSPLASLGPWNARFGGDPAFLRDPVLQTRGDLDTSLDDEVPWLKDGQGFAEKVKRLARSLGYP